MTHTPGPWKVLAEEDGDTGVVMCEVLSASDGNIAYVNDPSLTDDDVMLANARLIAAAPDLLEALEQAALELEEAANVLENSLPSLASIYRAAAENKRAAIKAARP